MGIKIQINKTPQMSSYNPNVKSILFYGFFRNNNNAGRALINEAVTEMNINRGQVENVKLVDDYFATAVLNRIGHKTVGQVLSCNDDRKWNQKLARFDQIYGYNPHNPERSLYQRSIVRASMIDGINEYAYIYHKTDADESKPIASGDWSSVRR